jgi:hypothetical protein
MPIVLRIAEASFAESIARHFEFGTTYSAAALAAPAFVGLSRLPGSRGRVAFASQDFAIGEIGIIEDFPSIPPQDAILIAMSREGDFAIAHDFSELVPAIVPSLSSRSRPSERERIPSPRRQSGFWKADSDHFWGMARGNRRRPRIGGPGFSESAVRDAPPCSSCYLQRIYKQDSPPFDANLQSAWRQWDGSGSCDHRYPRRGVRSDRRTAYRGQREGAAGCDHRLQPAPCAGSADSNPFERSHSATRSGTRRVQCAFRSAGHWWASVRFLTIDRPVRWNPIQRKKARTASSRATNRTARVQMNVTMTHR